MIETLLIAVADDKEQTRPVVEHAAEIAASLSARVVLYHAYEPEEFERLLSSLSYESADPAELARQHTAVDDAAEILNDAGVEFSVAASTGEADEELSSYIETHDVDHVFLGRRERSPVGKAILGSVSQQVVLNTDAPCTLVG